MTSKAAEILRDVRERQRVDNRRVRGCTCPPSTPPDTYAAGCPPHEDFMRELHERFTRPHACGCPGGDLTAWSHACGHTTCDAHRADHRCEETR